MPQLAPFEEEFLLGRWDGENEPRGMLPDELYLRGLFTLDLNDANAVADFVNEHGLPVDEQSGWRDFVGDQAMGWATDPTMDFADRHHARLREIETAVRERISRAVAAGDRSLGVSWAERGLFHLDEVRIRLALLRDLARTWTS